MGIQEIAEEIRTAFESRQRDNGNRFVALADNAPDWVQDMVQNAHGGMLPDDWKYECIRAAVESIADGIYDPHEFADGYVDAYTSDLTAWYGSHVARQAYCEDAAEELGIAPDASIEERMRLGQYMESCEVFSAVLAAIEEREGEE